MPRGTTTNPGGLGKKRFLTPFPPLFPPTIGKITGVRAHLRVYNIEVDGLHNYAVGMHGVLVHNKPMENARPLQTGGNKINNATAKALGLEKREAGRALESLKKDLGIPNNHHGKIMSNGDYVDSHTGETLGNIYDHTN